MERLTCREMIVSNDCTEIVGCNHEKADCNDNCMYGYCKWVKKAVRKLKEYEDAEEQGLLLRLPQRTVFETIGGTVYYVFDYEITECINCGISVDCEGNLWATLSCDESIFPYREPIAGIDTDPTDWCQNWTYIGIDRWQESVFFTKEEAEAALAEMEKNGA